MDDYHYHTEPVFFRSNSAGIAIKGYKTMGIHKVSGNVDHMSFTDEMGQAFDPGNMDVIPRSHVYEDPTPYECKDLSYRLLKLENWIDLVKIRQMIITEDKDMLTIAEKLIESAEIEQAAHEIAKERGIRI